MRRLSSAEHGMLADVFAELAQHLTRSQMAVQRARTGSELNAYVELDHAVSALDDLIALAAELDPVLTRLSQLTQRETKARGRAPRLARDDGRRRIGHHREEIRNEHIPA